jgi:NAD(P)-dependent dehydrogenase (short-subunit alcohol dehydrogenase family)
VIDDQHLYRTPLLLEFQSKLLADGVEQGNCAIRIRLCRKLVKEAHKKLGGLDILACVAGKQHAVEKIAELTTQQVEETYRVNVFALFWLCQEALPLMPPGSSIITTASIQATHPSPSLLDYAPTKDAILAFTRGLARQVAEDGIRVNCVAPGPVWTPFQTSGRQPAKKIPAFGSETPMKRPGQPVEMAPLYVLLASQESSYVTGEVYGAQAVLRFRNAAYGCEVKQGRP